MEKVEDRDTYKLKLTMKNGSAIHVWIDAQTFWRRKSKASPGGWMEPTIQWKSTFAIIGR